MSRRKPMQVSIERILEAHGQLEAFREACAEDNLFCLKLKKENYHPLTIEKVGLGKVAIAHTYIQNGDVMFDPEIVFLYYPDWPPETNFNPVEITQHPVGIYRRKFFEQEDGKRMVDMSFDASVSKLVRVWAKNLRHQGWEDAEIERLEVGPWGQDQEPAQVQQLTLF